MHCAVRSPRKCGHWSPIAPGPDLSQPLHLFVDKVVDGAEIMLRQPQRAAWNHLREELEASHCCGRSVMLPTAPLPHGGCSARRGADAEAPAALEMAFAFRSRPVDVDASGRIAVKPIDE